MSLEKPSGAQVCGLPQISRTLFSPSPPISCPLSSLHRKDAGSLLLSVKMLPSEILGWGHGTTENLSSLQMACKLLSSAHPSACLHSWSPGLASGGCPTANQPEWGVVYLEPFSLDRREVVGLRGAEGSPTRS